MRRAPPAWTTITLTPCATTSWSSRATRRALGPDLGAGGLLALGVEAQRLLAQRLVEGVAHAQAASDEPRGQEVEGDQDDRVGAEAVVDDLDRHRADVGGGERDVGGAALQLLAQRVRGEQRHDERGGQVGEVGQEGRLQRRRRDHHRDHRDGVGAAPRERERRARGGEHVERHRSVQVARGQGLGGQAREQRAGDQRVEPARGHAATPATGRRARTPNPPSARGPASKSPP